MASTDHPHAERGSSICLIGYRGTGKTTVAQILAERLGWPTCDTDIDIVASAGRSIAEIFAADGEKSFRDRETAAVMAALAEPGRVVSLGGGAVLREENRRALAAATTRVVWLTAAAETILTRLSADPATAEQRPNLTADGGLQEIRQVLAEREPIYRECADLEVDTEGKDVARVVHEIIERLGLEAQSG
ncbi:MAG: shikimate kinase [Planctomycetota bacterium]|nr:MAG: shikimate kinase [Planctomycetota bacterium]REK43323.1 MAG: shikimate kinase [Planctomycetota bacterium]